MGFGICHFSPLKSLMCGFRLHSLRTCSPPHGGPNRNAEVPVVGFPSIDGLRARWPGRWFRPGGSSSPRTGTRRTACDLHSLAGAMALEHPSVEGGSVLGVSKVHPEASKKVLHSLFSRCSAAQGRVRSSRQKLEFTHPSRSPFTPEKPLGGDVANLLR